MPADLDVLSSKGFSKERLKEIFTKTPEERLKDKDLPKDGEETTKVDSLIKLHKGMMATGVSENMRDARYWHAIDLAYDVAHRQTTQTLVAGLIDRAKSEDEVLSTVREWGLNSVLTDVLDDQGRVVLMANGLPSQRLDVPTFFQIYVPLVMSYTKVRWAKLFKDRDQWPLYKFDPAYLTEDEKLKCDLITSWVQQVSTNMGYRAIERDSILPMLLYGFAINFPTEQFYAEKSEYMVDKESKEYVVREGVRFHIPHPARVFYDRSHPLHTVNTDTGIQYLGYWTTVRYGEMRQNTDYYNTKSISIGKDSWPGTKAYSAFNEVYPCTINFPKFSGATGVGSNDREGSAFTYSKEHDTDGVPLTVLFHKIVPKEYGLYDYDKPVWHRFVYAGDDTVLFCEPMPYTPAVAYLYDFDPNRQRNSGLGLELLPHQDHLGNLLSQYLLAVKQNLGSRPIFYDASILTKEEVGQIRNMGEKVFRGMLMLPFNTEKKNLGWSQQRIEQAFHVPQLPLQNTQEIVMAINTMISVMERLLGFSAQEVGAAASHEQSATESTIIHSNSSVRMDLTGGFVDDAMHARKVLLYDAMMACGSDEVLAEVAELTKTSKATLEKWGFKVEGDVGAHAGVRGSKKSLRVTSFATNREGASRVADAKVAMTMMTVLQSAFSNPLIVQEVGSKHLLDLFNEVLVWAGVPTDWRFKPNPDGPTQDQQEDQQKQLTEFVQKVTEGEIGKFSEVLKKQALEPLADQSKQLQEALQGLAGQTEQGISKVFQEVGQALAQSAQAEDQKLAQMFVKMAQLVDQRINQALPPSPVPPPGMGMLPQPMLAAPMPMMQPPMR